MTKLLLCLWHYYSEPISNQIEMKGTPGLIAKFESIDLRRADSRSPTTYRCRWNPRHIGGLAFAGVEQIRLAVPHCQPDAVRICLPRQLSHAIRP